MERIRCGVVEIGDDTNAPACRQTPSQPAVLVHGDNHGTIQNVHIDNVNIIVTGDDLGDMVKAGSTRESELIRKTILENAELRRMVRTVENAPSAIFKLTKGVDGPHHMRNVRKQGTHACELTDQGPRVTPMIEYCKKTAISLVDELKHAVRSVGPDASQALKEWARDVDMELRKKKKNVDYVSALELYRDASSKFYKLPHKDAIAQDVRMIAGFMSNMAPF